jgi:hypothetical protein
LSKESEEVHRQKFRRGRCWLKNSGQAQRLGRLLSFYGRHQRSEMHWLQTLEGAKIAALESARVTLSPSSTILSQAGQRPRSNQSPRAEACQDCPATSVAAISQSKLWSVIGPRWPHSLPAGACSGSAVSGGQLTLLHASGTSLLGITKTCRSAPKQSAAQRYFLEARETHRVPAQVQLH